MGEKKILQLLNGIANHNLLPHEVHADIMEIIEAKNKAIGEAIEWLENGCFVPDLETRSLERTFEKGLKKTIDSLKKAMEL